MYDNRFFDFVMQNEALKKAMMVNKVALIIFEAFRMWQETMGDISVEDATDAQNIAKLFFERLDVNKSNEFLDRINLILKS
ncbi:hypothetical protein [Barnesiella intestinihominis]|uniref:hypothetical protein n=1 Tax=Barnesiella intestinihominis TaxID=487174 RepID=UPI00242C1503|nr:hypothetical protein [Barnesiella intestinihominis]